MDALAAMPKYETYKESGVDWLGAIPREWDAVKMKYLYSDTSVKNKASETLLSVTQTQGVVPREWVENRMVMPSGNLASFKFIKEGDFAISLRSFEGGLEYCHHDGIISPAYTVLKAKLPYLHKGYYKYLFKSHAFISELQTSVVGIREGKNISYEELRYSLLPIPSSPEQSKIANFLDEKTAQVDEAIAIKEKQIALLKEGKQIIIQKAVTQGLNPNAPMKDSGVEWIGQIPEHWELKKIKHVAGNFMYGTSVDCNSFADGTPVLRIPNINELDFDFNELKFAQLSKEETDRYLLSKDDILIIRTNGNPALVGKSALFTGSGDYMFASYLIRLKPLKNVVPDFLIRSLNSFSIRGALTHGARTSVGNYNLNTQTLGDCYIAFPPKREQIEIAQYLEQQQKDIEQGLILQKQQIEKLKEYKATLINSAVTGKIKVA